MKRIIRLNKRFISLFLAVMMIYSMAFSGIKVSAATTGLTISVSDSSNQSIPQYTNSGGLRVDNIFNSNNSVRSTPVRLAANANAKISYNFNNATMAKYQFVKANDLTTQPALPQDLTMTNINLPAPNSHDAYASDIGTQGTISTMQYVYAGNSNSASDTAQLTRTASFGTPLSSTMLVQNATVGKDIPYYTDQNGDAFFSTTGTNLSTVTDLYTTTKPSNIKYTVKKNNTTYYSKYNASWKAMKFWGYFQPKDTGYYNLGAFSDDGAYGYIIKDGQQQVFVNDWSINQAFPRTENNPILLNGGSYYPIYMEWYEGNPTQGAFVPVFKYDSSNSSNTRIAFSKDSTGKLKSADSVAYKTIFNVDTDSDKLISIPQDYFWSSKTTTPGTIPGAYFGDVSGIPFPTQDGIYYIATKFLSDNGATTTSGLYGPFIIDKTPPTISSLYVVSDYSGNNKKAGVGNTLTITFKASEPLQANPQIFIDGYVASVVSYTKDSNDNYTATVKIKSDGSINSSGDEITQTGPINVQIANYSDLSGNVGLPVQDSSVTFINATGINLTLTQNPIVMTNGNVTITANASASGSGNSIKTIKWTSGSQSVNYFTAGGTSIYDSGISGNKSTAQSTFNVNANGVYTVYSTDSNGNIAVQTINVENIFVAKPVITLPTTGTVTNNNTPTITGTAQANSTVKIYDGAASIGTANADVNGNWTLIPATALSDGAHTITATATATAATATSAPSDPVNIIIDTIQPVLTLTPSSANGTVTITGTATDNVAVASITKPDNKVVTGSSTTYTVNTNGTYTFTATDTAGNATTQSINISSIVISGTTDTSFPNINASLTSVSPNSAKSTDEITVKYAIKADDFSLLSGKIDEAEVLVDMSQAMKNNQRFSELQNGFVNQVLNDSNLSSIKLGVVGYNGSVYIGTRSNYTDPKSSVMKPTDENLSNIDKTNFLPLYNLNDANTKDGYRQFYQNGYIYNNISSDDQRQFGSALKVADNVLTNYGTNGAKKAIIIVSSGNLTYSDDQIKSIIGKGYKIIVMDISNSANTNIKNTYLKLCGNDFGITGNYYIGTLNDGVNYNSVDADMKNVDASLKGITGVTTLSINDAKLNVDLGGNFKAIANGGLQGSGKVCTVNIPQINFTYDSTSGKWKQNGSVEVTFKVQAESGKSGQLGFGVYTNADNTIKTNTSNISYTNFYNILTSKIIVTPTINIIAVSPPEITDPKDGTSTSSSTPTITGTGKAGYTVTVYDGTTAIGTATVDSSGNWSLTPTTGLANGNHVITATQADAAGNASGVSNTVNLTIDTTAPVITIAPYNTNPTNQDIIVTATTNKGTLNAASHTFSANGSFTFIATDSFGNTTNKEVDITNIDKIAPILNLTQSSPDGTTAQVTITATAIDSGSGVATITPSDSNLVQQSTTTDTSGTVNKYFVSDNGTYTFTATDKANNTTTPQSITISSIYAPSSISQHGIYSGSNSGILNDKNVTNGIPVTMAIIVDSKSSHPEITWSCSDNGKLEVDTTSFKEYDISSADNSTISNLRSLDIDDSGNITGLVMEKGKKYLIIYTMTPIVTGQVTVTATADGDKTNSKSVNLNIGAQPDLF